VAGVTPLDPDWQVTVLPNKLSPTISRQSRNHAFNLLERKQMRIPIALHVLCGHVCHSLSNRFKRQLSTKWLNIPVPWQAMATSHLGISSLGEPDNYGSPEWVPRLPLTWPTVADTMSRRSHAASHWHPSLGERVLHCYIRSGM
jgi:hypothetical protein